MSREEEVARITTINRPNDDPVAVQVPATEAGFSHPSITSRSLESLAASKRG
ncbi:hypothetical protein GJ744_006962 [Endocarpon pusillum]|uniref:Uncharacterized protein n=1 Tax=Endocarpon pusillum TaxID=364733 RepID=A0A8H7E7Z7_9EURO|nr:hypothetical protein GJ744_006962 [Endocarpon pusillum]